MRKTLVYQYTIILFFGVSSLWALGPEQHREVALRQIAHEMLLYSGDSTSRVLPVQRLNGHYLISFSAPLEIVPDSLILVADRVLESARLGLHYSIEVLSCDSNQVVYSFERSPIAHNNILPCLGRNLERDCYHLRISIEEGEVQMAEATLSNGQHEDGSAWTYYMLVLAVLLGIAYWWLNTRGKRRLEEEGWLSLGVLKFHPKQMLLQAGETKFELSAKEADLLAILLQHSNQTMAREELLQEVWGDDGDYVGRTLDVFISKLRKKLEIDPSVKIQNIRGVGYRLIT